MSDDIKCTLRAGACSGRGGFQGRASTPRDLCAEGAERTCQAAISDMASIEDFERRATEAEKQIAELTKRIEILEARQAQASKSNDVSYNGESIQNIIKERDELKEKVGFQA